MTPNLTAFTGVDSQNLPDVMVSVQFILAIGEKKLAYKVYKIQVVKPNQTSVLKIISVQYKNLCK
ncbi:hypothetical protein LOC04_10735 [Lactobacillus delbrueckii subsp. lactis]|uniref:hypothetical protein n=1 Tax=Lactobacillus delbrueckii TaxID=1584 RepID=UPI001E3551FB|nr:hypothetical protein [Lactobacillus delbrueckii]MCD5560648.1 hypothetical protein [Lactobacillus delbrueckii subsp. lactis]